MTIDQPRRRASRRFNSSSSPRLTTGRTLARAFCLFLIGLGLLLPPLAGTLQAVAFAQTDADETATVQDQAAPVVHLIPVDGTITPIVARHVDRSIARAEREGAVAVILYIDTPGGLSTAMDDIIRDTLEAEVPVIAFVGPSGARAASAGTFITYASHIAAMAPNTRIGSASVVSADGAEISDTMERKVTNDAVAQIRNLANLRDRNADWAEAAVRDAENITADQALDLNVIDLIAPNIDALLLAVDGQEVELASGSVTLRTAGATVVTTEMTWFEGFLQLLAEPTVAYLLLSIGSIGLFLELSNPGATIPGVVGGLCLLMGLFALGTLPVNWAGVLLMGLGLIFLVVDVFVPSFGALTVGGLAAFVTGSYLLFGDGAPPGYEVSPYAIWGVTGGLIIFFVFVAGAVARARLSKPTTGAQGLLGAIGRARTELAPTGLVFLQGEIWQAEVAVTEDGETGPSIPAGTEVAVTALEGLHLRVRPATAEDRARANRRGRVGLQDRRSVVPVRTVGMGARYRGDA